MPQTTLFGNRIIIRNIHDAKEHLMNFLRERGYNIIKVVPSNFGRHYIIWYHDPDLDTIRKIYLIYQRRWFESFEQYFGIPDQAVTVNLSILSKIVHHNYSHIVWCNMDGNLFIINSLKAMQLVYENGWIRRTEKTGETVAHIPLSKLIKLR